MTEVRAHDGESIESLIRRFTKKMTNSGVMQDAKAKQEFTKPSDLVRKAKAASKSRIRKHQKKMEQQADYENNNKFRPRRPGPQFPRPDNQDNRNSQDNRNNPNNPNSLNNLNHQNHIKN